MQSDQMLWIPCVPFTIIIYFQFVQSEVPKGEMYVYVCVCVVACNGWNWMRICFPRESYSWMIWVTSKKKNAIFTTNFCYKMTERKGEKMKYDTVCDDTFNTPSTHTHLMGRKVNAFEWMAISNTHKYLHIQMLGQLKSRHSAPLSLIHTISFVTVRVWNR